MLSRLNMDLILDIFRNQDYFIHVYKNFIFLFELFKFTVTKIFEDNKKIHTYHCLQIVNWQR